MKKISVVGIIFYLSAISLMAQTPSDINNPSFESGAEGWNNLSVGSHEYFAPVDGIYYAVSRNGRDYTSQLTDITIESGKSYSLSVWARSIYSDEYIDCLLNCDEDELPQGNSASVKAKVKFYYESTEISSITQSVSPTPILGDPEIYPNDDGGNVWIDGDFRMEFADNVFFQNLSADPIYDPWTIVNDSDYDHDMAVGPVITPQGLKAIYNSYATEWNEIYSSLWLLTASGSPPDYDWTPQGTLISNSVDEWPWVIDAHLFYDDDTGKLWMSWGGGRIYVSEMDPVDGQLIGHPEGTEFDNHPEGTHTSVAFWRGDEWTGDNKWFEGPALYKHNDYWYLFASYGNLGANYSIRMGRGTSPTGQFLDKDSVGLSEWYSSEAEYGNSFLLADDGEQLCPGHPHIWEENGKFFMGYDYILEKLADEEWDILGIRRLYWVNDWPTIWTPVKLKFNADDHPDAIGKKLGISFRNVGGVESVLAVDSLTLSVSDITGVKEITNGSLPAEFNLYQNYPNPFNPATTIQYSIPVAALSSSPSFTLSTFEAGAEGTVEGLGQNHTAGQLVTLKVYDVLGIEVATLVNDYQHPGNYEVAFDASSLSSGIYFYKLKAGSYIQTKKCLLLK